MARRKSPPGILLVGLPGAGAGALRALLEAGGFPASPPAFTAFHDAFHAARPAGGPGPSLAEAEAARELVAGLRLAEGPWLLADGRALGLAELWRGALPEARLLIVYRHPLETLAAHGAAVLQPWQAGAALALELLRQQRRRVLLVHVHAALDRPDLLADRLGERLGLRPPGPLPEGHAGPRRLSIGPRLDAAFRRLAPAAAAAWQELESAADLPRGLAGAGPLAELDGAADDLEGLLGRTAAAWQPVDTQAIRRLEAERLGLAERERTLLAELERCAVEIAQARAGAERLAAENAGVVAEFGRLHAALAEQGAALDAERARFQELAAARDHDRRDLGRTLVEAAELAAATSSLRDREAGLERELEDARSRLDAARAARTLLEDQVQRQAEELAGALARAEAAEAELLRLREEGVLTEGPAATPLPVAPDTGPEMHAAYLALRDAIVARRRWGLADARTALNLPAYAVQTMAGAGEARGAGPATRATVVVLARGEGQGLVDTLERVLAQSHRDLDVVVVQEGLASDEVAGLADALASGRVSVVRLGRGRGPGAALDVGLRQASGAIVGVLDAGARPHPGWLEEALRVLADDASVGAVAPLVFAASRPLVLLGAGGTLGRRGQRVVHVAHEPAEFVELPGEVLYPLRCGLVARRGVLERAAPLGEGGLDDVEIGLCAWASGLRVTVAPRSWVDATPELGAGETRERARLRSLLVALPWSQLPGGLASRRSRSELLRAIGWNLLRLPGALRRRGRLAQARASLPPLLAADELARRVVPPNESFRPRPERCGGDLHLDGTDESALVYGFHAPESDGHERFRWTDLHASALLRLLGPAHGLEVRFCLPVAVPCRIVARRWGSLEPLLEAPLEPTGPGWTWSRRELPGDLPAGDLEVQVVTEDGHTDARNRRLGVALARLRAPGAP